MKVTIRGRVYRISENDTIIGQYVLKNMQENLEDGEIVTVTGNTKPYFQSFYTLLIVDYVVREIRYDIVE